MTTAQLDNIFTYHKPFGDQPERYQMIRKQARQLAHAIYGLCPDCQERSAAFTLLQQAVMMANAAIACNESEERYLQSLKDLE